MDWQALGLSLRLSLATMLVLVVFGMPMAYWLAFSRRRWKPVIEALVALPLVLPPTVLGFYVLLALGPSSPLGALCERVFGHRLPFTFTGLLVASVLYSFPFAVQPFSVAFTSVDAHLLEASACSGAGRLKTFFRLVLPLSWAGVLTGLVLSFAHTLGEFGVVLMVGGNIPGATRTVSIAIYDQVQSLDYSAAMRTSGLLLGISFGVLVLTYSLRKVRLFP